MVSNDLGLRSRRFTIRQLEPETSYELKIKANNPAGSTDFSHSFETVSSFEAGSRQGRTGTQLGIGSSNLNQYLNCFYGNCYSEFRFCLVYSILFAEMFYLNYLIKDFFKDHLLKDLFEDYLLKDLLRTSSSRTSSRTSSRNLLKEPPQGPSPGPLQGLLKDPLKD